VLLHAPRFRRFGDNALRWGGLPDALWSWENILDGTYCGS
jgi:hypothetical protein